MTNTQAGNPAPTFTTGNAGPSFVNGKEGRPWFKKKRFILPIAAVVLMVGAGIAGGGSDTKTDTSNTAAASNDNKTAVTEAKTPVLFPGRVDAQKEDQERNIGEAAKLSGYTATVTSGVFKQSVSSYERDGYVIADVTVENRDSSAQPFNTFDWKLQTPAGQVIDPTYVTGVNSIGSGDLVKGGTKSGQVAFETGSTKGDYFVIYKPDGFDAARGIWKVTVN